MTGHVLQLAQEVVACEDVVEWFDYLAPRPELTVLPDVDHFFHGRLTLLRKTVVDYFHRQLADQSRDDS